LNGTHQLLFILTMLEGNINTISKIRISVTDY